MVSYHRIACISTSRADAGIYRPLLRALSGETRFESIVLAGGTHLSNEFGGTLDGFSGLSGVQIVPVDHFQPGDDAVAVARSTGAAVGAFAAALVEQRPDLVFVLGDRTEMLAAALAATIVGLPIAHLHGGDTTAGAYDDVCRHAVSKLAHLHLPALPQHAEVIRALGEAPWRIHLVGALAMDELREFRPEPAVELSAALGIDFEKPTIVVVFHAETLSDTPADRQVDVVLSALRASDAGLLLVAPNADVGHGAVRKAMTQFAASRPRTAMVASLPQRRFWSALAHAEALVGNSSAGLLEAASLRVPVVNIGRRQEGRVRAANVIDVDFDPGAISKALVRARAPAFRRSIASLTNPYGDGRAAERIIAVLDALPERVRLLQKSIQNSSDEPTD